MAEEIKKTKSDAALREEKILEFWRENKIFKKSLEKKAPKGHYVFYDGPPFATGQMHYGHILGSTVKDTIGRYKTMQGYYVPRKWGWDCHGLPIENIVEKELGVAGHKEIEALGIDKFVEHARSKVLQYDKDWEKGVERIGRWVDFQGGYKTMDNTFIESVWWALSELNKKNLIYEGVKVLAYCPRCETPIANSEIAMDNSYKDISDISVYVKFELENEQGTYFLAWTTTPWTLPGNTAIAVNKNIDYVKVKRLKGWDLDKKALYDQVILAKEIFERISEKPGANIPNDPFAFLFQNTPEGFEVPTGPVVTKVIKGSELVGLFYKPVFRYYENEVNQNPNIWKVWHADFVTVEKGTGIAHEAPAFGEDDMNLAKQNNIPWILHVDETGRFKAEVVDFAGMHVKPKGEEKDSHQKADIEVIKYLAKNGLLFAKEKIVHSYPHCMRCDTPIIYYALPSWFINITKEKNNIVNQAKNINWIPSHLKEGRFKNIVENAPDWNISRNRYWASPLPIWKCEKCKKQTFIDSLENLKKRTKKSGNKYFVMRHGGTEANNKGLISFKNQLNDNLTTKGMEEVARTALKIANEKIDLIIASPFTRTRETTEILKEKLGLEENQIIFDDRLHEVNAGDFDSKNWDEYHKHILNVGHGWFEHKISNGESLKDVAHRTGEVLYELENKHKNKNILIVTHGGPAWLLFVNSGLYIPENKPYQIPHTEAFVPDFKRFDNAEVRELPFVSLPHNKNYELDLHRPYIDEVLLICDCGGDLKRIPEVLDCWFESGSMPFAQDHYPFENKNWKKNNFPAGFVAEYLGQVRTWFYYTHVVSSILFNHTPFNNIISTGTVRAEDGEKMSKSRKNYPDPWSFIDKYGVDALRIYLLSSTLMKGEDSNFSEKGVQDISSKIIGRLFNVLAFYELYRDKEIEKKYRPNSKNILDNWILLRLDNILSEITKGMESYDVAEAMRPLDLFVDDLSTWYLRRSRERIKNGDKDAKQTLYFVLKTLAKLIAPFAPFTAEDIWLKLKNEKDEDSVHLEKWPEAGEINTHIIDEMKLVREIVTLGLEARQKAGIKVRQPLAKLEVKSFDLSQEYVELIKDEINIKEVKENKNIATDVKLDTNITAELKQEGDYRELVRALQDIRKKMGLTPSDIVLLTFETNDAGRKLVQKFENDMKKTVLASEIEFKANEGEEVKIDELVFRVKIDKI